MTDKEYRETKRKVKGYFLKWQKTLGLGYWDDIRIQFHRDMLDAPNRNSLAFVDINWCYQQATVKFFLPLLVEKDDAEIENCVVHELVHILTSELICFGADSEDHKEHGTVDVTKAFLWVRDAGRDGKL